jgi:hypothetical protein
VSGVADLTEQQRNALAEIVESTPAVWVVDALAPVVARMIAEAKAEVLRGGEAIHRGVLAQAQRETKAEALREAARYFEYEMAPAWGGDATWLSTGNRVADLVGSTLRDRADEIEGGGDDA